MMLQGIGGGGVLQGASVFSSVRSHRPGGSLLYLQVRQNNRPSAVISEKKIRWQTVELFSGEASPRQ